MEPTAHESLPAQSPHLSALTPPQTLDLAGVATAPSNATAQPEATDAGLPEEEEEGEVGEEDEDKRVCAWCSATKTPLWRAGPGGPRTLCNACGVRFTRMKKSGMTPDDDNEQRRRQKRKRMMAEPEGSALLSEHTSLEPLQTGAGSSWDCDRTTTLFSEDASAQEAFPLPSPLEGHSRLDLLHPHPLPQAPPPRPDPEALRLALAQAMAASHGHKRPALAPGSPSMHSPSSGHPPRANPLAHRPQPLPATPPMPFVHGRGGAYAASFVAPVRTPALPIQARVQAPDPRKGSLERNRAMMRAAGEDLTEFRHAIDAVLEGFGPHGSASQSPPSPVSRMTAWGEGLHRAHHSTTCLASLDPLGSSVSNSLPPWQPQVNNFLEPSDIELLSSFL